MAEGKAKIIDATVPGSFTPGTTHFILVKLKNVGSAADVLFARLINNDTGKVLGESFMGVNPGATTGEGITPALRPFIVKLTQTTDFHGKIEAGHIE